MKRREAGVGLLAVLFFLVAGISAGAFAEVMMGDSLFREVSRYVEGFFQFGAGQAEAADIFFRSLKQNGFLLLLSAAGGLTVIGFPVIFGVLLYKGASLGFTFALLVDTMGAKGIFTSAASLLIQNFILIPMFLIFSFFSLSFSFSVLFCPDRRIRGKTYRNAVGFFFLCLLFALAVLVIGCLAEAFGSGTLCAFFENHL